MKRMMSLVAVASVLFGNSIAQAGGPRVGKVDRVRVFTTDVYEMTFRGGELALVVVSGDGDTDLDLYVYDELGNLVAEDEDGTDQCLVRWAPLWRGSFVVKIVNRGAVYNNYLIRTN